MTYFNSASNPADNGANAGPNVSITPPASMVVGDLIFVVLQYRGTVTFSVSTSGGQTWASAVSLQSGNLTLEVFYAIFNGTWAADPVFTNTTGTNALTGVMHVFRATSGSTFTGLDADITFISAYAAPATPFDVNTTTLASTKQSYVAVPVFSSDDDNTWTLQTGGWTNAGTAQYRNTTGQDQSNSSAYQFFTAPGSVAGMTNRQATLGGDPGIVAQVGFYETPTLQRQIRAGGGLAPGAIRPATRIYRVRPAAAVAGGRSFGTIIG